LKDPGFRTDIQRVRHKFQIPEDGFSDKQTQLLWFEKHTDEYGDFIDAYNKIIKKHRIAVLYANKLEDFILNGNLFQIYPSLADVFCSLDTKNDVKIIVHDYANKDDVLNFVNKNWDLIREKQSKHLGKRIKASKHTERDRIIVEVYSRSVEELGLKRGMHRDIRVAQILRENYGIKVTPENIRRIVSQFKKNTV
jgi:hypothetical protein